ncbi:hypothetical protein QGN32_06455 [Mycolicibacterium sp. ND9-15]|nr:hypothetical protein [Mycolicibacterium sp. ND9-15]WSE57516.1 hypothetical protein QGN32_06455 [Mycolicibacterium sp. ND9-15]
MAANMMLIVSFVNIVIIESRFSNGRDPEGFPARRDADGGYLPAQQI